MNHRNPEKPVPRPEDGDHWGLDPHDVKLHQRRMRETRAVGPLGKFFRFIAVALALAAVAWVYWNFDTVRAVRLDLSRLTSAFSRDAESTGTGTQSGGEAGSEVVEGNRVVGVAMPTSLNGETPPTASEELAAVERPVDAAAAIQAELNAAPPITPAEPGPPPPPEPEEPPKPEMFGFGVSVMHVSEADASAAVLVLRDGGRRQATTITWWTTDGTAKAGADFARLDRRTERFGGGEQNRTLHVPIVGDRAAEGAENFYVHISVGDSTTPVAQIEVVIDDDD